jgi:hypothetical protein
VWFPVILFIAKQAFFVLECFYQSSGQFHQDSFCGSWSTHQPLYWHPYIKSVGGEYSWFPIVALRTSNHVIVGLEQNGKIIA